MAHYTYALKRDVGFIEEKEFGYAERSGGSEGRGKKGAPRSPKGTWVEEGWPGITSYLARPSFGRCLDASKRQLRRERRMVRRVPFRRKLAQAMA